jgi:hypothetical protein
VDVALGWSKEALLGLALGVRPAADAVAGGVGVGGSVVGVVGVAETGVDELDARRVGMAVGEALGDGDVDRDVAAPSRTGDGTGRGRVPAPAGPTGTTV